MLKHHFKLLCQILVLSFIAEAFATSTWWGQEIGWSHQAAWAQDEPAAPPAGQEERYEDQYYGDEYVDGQRVRRPRVLRKELIRDPVRRRRRYRGNRRYYEYRYGDWRFNEQQPSDLHSAQEGEFDEPYKWELDFDVDFIRSTSSTDGAEAEAFGSFNFSADALYVFTQKFQAGPLFVFDQVSTSSVNSTRSLSFGARLKYNFGMIDEDVWLLFVEGRFAFGNRASTDPATGDFLDGNPSVLFGAGVGLHYFVDSNVALTAIVDFRRTTISLPNDTQTVQNDLGLLRAGLSIFL